METLRSGEENTVTQNVSKGGLILYSVSIKIPNLIVNSFLYPSIAMILADGRTENHQSESLFCRALLCFEGDLVAL
jgi:hypothetical protein